MSPLRYSLRGRVTDCLQLVFRTPRDSVRRMIPRGFRLVTYEEKWAFWHVSICRLEHIRPPWLPEACSVTSHAAFYRLLVKVPLTGGTVMRGLHYIRSDADNRMLSSFGNLMTDFHFHPAHIAIVNEDGSVDATVEDTRDGEADSYLLGQVTDEYILEADSIFPDAEVARKFLHTVETGVSLDKGGRVVDLVQVERNGGPELHPLRVGRHGFTFFRHIGQHDAALELAAWATPTETCWRMGNTSLLN